MATQKLFRLDYVVMFFSAVGGNYSKWQSLATVAFYPSGVRVSPVVCGGGLHRGRLREFEFVSLLRLIFENVSPELAPF